MIPLNCKIMPSCHHATVDDMAATSEDRSPREHQTKKEENQRRNVQIRRRQDRVGVGVGVGVVVDDDNEEEGNTRSTARRSRSGLGRRRPNNTISGVLGPTIARSSNSIRPSSRRFWRRTFKVYVFGSLVLLLIGVYMFGVLRGFFFVGHHQQYQGHAQTSLMVWEEFLDLIDAGTELWSSSHGDGGIGGFGYGDYGDDDDDDVAHSEEDTDDSTTVVGFIRKLSKIVSGRTRSSRSHNSNGRRFHHEPIPVLYQDGPSNLRLPKPIINVGFPKAGTSSIFSFFHCNGLKSQHWYCCEDQNHPTSTERRMLMSSCMMENMISARRSNNNNNNNNENDKRNNNVSSPSTTTPLLFEGCGEYDVYTEINGPRNFIKYNKQTLLDDGSLLPPSISSNERMQRIWFPQHFHLDEIHRQFPNATFILNQRHPVDEWVKSVMLWNNHLDFQILNEFYAHNKTRHIFPDDFVAEQQQQQQQQQNNNKNGDKGNKDGNRHLKQTATGYSAATSGPVVFKYKNVRDALRITYHHHVEYVKEFVRNHPSHALIEVDITSNETGKQLASSFGLHEECWGHFNQRGGANSKHRRPPERRGWKRKQLTKKYKLDDNNRRRQEDHDDERHGRTQGSDLQQSPISSLEEKRRLVRERKAEQQHRKKERRYRLAAKQQNE